MGSSFFYILLRIIKQFANIKGKIFTYSDKFAKKLEWGYFLGIFITGF